MGLQGSPWSRYLLTCRFRLGRSNLKELLPAWSSVELLSFCEVLPPEAPGKKESFTWSVLQNDQLKDRMSWLTLKFGACPIMVVKKHSSFGGQR